MPNKISECFPGVYKIDDGLGRFLIIYNKPQFDKKALVWKNCEILNFTAITSDIINPSGIEWDDVGCGVPLDLVMLPFQNMEEKISQIRRIIVERNINAKIKT